MSLRMKYDTLAALKTKLFLITFVVQEIENKRCINQDL